MVIEKRSILTSILLTFVTCGLYGVYWFCCVTNDAAKASGDDSISGGKAFFLGIITYILTIKNFCDIIFTVIIKTILIIFKYISLPIKHCFILLRNVLKKLMKFFNNRRIANEKHS